LVKKTSLPRDVIEKAAGRLKGAGLLEVLVDERGYESWRVSEAALAAVAGDRRRPVWQCWACRSCAGLLLVV
jgi:hypothetical protein